jgi:hypothetical protein
MNAIIPTRRTMLGSLGAAALAGIAFPWRAKANDIVIASELPPDPQPVEVARVDAPAADLSPGVTLYDKAGREVAIVTYARMRDDRARIARPDPRDSDRRDAPAVHDALRHAYDARARQMQLLYHRDSLIPPIRRHSPARA